MKEEGEGAEAVEKRKADLRRERSSSCVFRVKDELHTLLTNPEVYPVELTLTSGDKVKITHPDYVFFSRKMGKIFFYPQDEDGVFEMITPDQVAKVKAKIKKQAA